MAEMCKTLEVLHRSAYSLCSVKEQRFNVTRVYCTQSGSMYLTYINDYDPSPRSCMDNVQSTEGKQQGNK